MTIVIVGGGHAGGQAAAGLRQMKCSDEIIIISAENYVPYQRPPLSKQYLNGEFGFEHVQLRDETFYKKNQIELRSNVTVQEIDATKQIVHCDDGKNVKYTNLIIATGSLCRSLDVPGSDLAGIYTLRSVDDCDHIRDDIVHVQNVLIVGGGYIGLEVASVCIEAGLNVTVVEMEDRILARVAAPEMSEFYTRMHTSRGVKIRTGTRVSSFQGENGRVSGAICSDGRQIDAELVVVGIGIVPNVALCESANLLCENGVLVNDRCRTQNESIYAIGDCTNHPNPLLDRRLRLESVPNAVDQARVAAANICGRSQSYAVYPWFWSDQYEKKLQITGFWADGDEHVVRGNEHSESFAVFYFHSGVLVAAEMIDSPRDFFAARQLMGRCLDPKQIADTHTDLRSLLMK